MCRVPTSTAPPESIPPDPPATQSWFAPFQSFATTATMAAAKLDRDRLYRHPLCPLIVKL